MFHNQYCHFGCLNFADNLSDPLWFILVAWACEVDTTMYLVWNLMGFVCFCTPAYACLKKCKALYVLFFCLSACVMCPCRSCSATALYQLIYNHHGSSNEESPVRLHDLTIVAAAHKLQAWNSIWWNFSRFLQSIIPEKEPKFEGKKKPSATWLLTNSDNYLWLVWVQLKQWLPPFFSFIGSAFAHSSLA